MAACSLGGTSSIKLSNFYSDFTRSNSCSLHSTYGIRTSVRQKSLHFAGLVLSRVPTKALILSCNPSTETATSSNIEDRADENISIGRKSPLIPNSFEVQSLLTEICDTSSIAEFELKLGGFQLYVKRDLAGKSKPSHSPSSALVSTSTPADTSDVKESVTTTSLVVSKPAPRTRGLQSWLVRAEDEGLAILKSPRVGFFRIARTKKGKRGPPACKENQVIKEGKVLCYIEQLGCQFPVQSDVSGEVVKILREDGDPIGYGDPLVAVLPSFPGIKKLH